MNEKEYRRMMVTNLIKLVDQDLNHGNISLVSVNEGETFTDMEFVLRQPYVMYEKGQMYPDIKRLSFSFRTLPSGKVDDL